MKLTALVDEPLRPGDPPRKEVEIVGKRSPIVRRADLCDRTTILRFVDCTDVLVDGGTFRNPLGPPDPDGQCIQFIRSTGRILRPTCYAGPAAEDLISIYADRPVKGTVLIQGAETHGRGTSDSSTSICCDGPYCPTTTLDGVRVFGARCGVTLAGGVGHRVLGNCTFDGCEAEVHVKQYYKGPFGNFAIARSIRVNG